MKKLFVACLAVMALAGGVGSAVAIDHNAPVKPSPRDPGPGVYKATVRWVSPHYGPDGRYYTYEYEHIVRSTHPYCDQAVQSFINSGAQVVTFCYFDPDF